VGGKSLVSCERKRSYHLFHAEAAILFLMWKKKKKKEPYVTIFCHTALVQKTSIADIVV
jgi:hypothetical protein